MQMIKDGYFVMIQSYYDLVLFYLVIDLAFRKHAHAYFKKLQSFVISMLANELSMILIKEHYF